MNPLNFQLKDSIDAETISDVFAYRRSEAHVRVIFVAITAATYAYFYNIFYGSIWAAIYLVAIIFENHLSRYPRIIESPFSIGILALNMFAFGSLALVAPDTPDASCVCLFAVLLHTIVTSRRCTPAFLAGAIPIVILFAAVLVQAYVSGVPPRRVIIIGMATVIASGFCTVVWNGYSKSLSQAMAASKAKSAFLANMSHELRTPLNGVVAMVSALQRTELSSAQHEMLGIISDSAASLQTLVSDILDLAKVEAGRIDLQSEPLAPAALARHVAALFREPAREKGLTFEIEADALSEVAVLGDSVRLTQILTNFCSNAVKFTTAGGVKLSVKSVQNAQTRSVRFDVADSGIGIPAEAKASIFERFSQADDSITRRFGGTGLGLAISKHLADLMGGRISVESWEEVGSTFSLQVDLPPAEAVSPTRKAAQKAWRTSSQALRHETAPIEATAHDPVASSEGEQPDDRPRLLLVEDHPTNRQVIQIMLGDLVKLDMACDGAEGLEAVKRSPYDLILMDMQMPVMDGLSATRAIRELEQSCGWPRTPIIVLSANALAEHIKASFEVGADRHLTKPVTADALLEAIDSALTDRASESAEPTAHLN